MARTITGLLRFDWPVTTKAWPDGQPILMPLPIGARLAGYAELDLLADALPDDPARADDDLVELGGEA